MPGRARRAARVAAMLLARLLASAALLALLVGAGVVGLLLHLELPVTRRVAAQALTRLLSDFFEGQVRVGHIDRLTLGRVSARDVVVRDTREREVLDVSELRIKTDLVRIGKQLWWGGPKETLIIDHIRLERAECELVPDRAGDVPSLVRALTPRPTPPRRPRAPPRHIRVWMPTVEVGKLWGRGRVGELPTLEAEVQNVRGSVLASPKGAAVDVHGFGAMVRGLGGADARGSGELHLRVPGPFWTWLNGRLGDVEVGAFVRVDGQRLAVRLELPRAEPEAVRALWPDWPLREQLRARIEATGELDALDTQAKLELGATRVSARGRVRLAHDPGLDLDVAAEHFDLQAVFADAPPTDLTLRTALALWRRDDGLVVDVNGTTQPTMVAGLPVPAVDLRGTVHMRGFEGQATVHEHGMPIKLAFTVSPSGAVDLDAHAPDFSIRDAPRLARLADVDARAELRVKAHIEQRRLSAAVEATVANLRMSGLRLQRGRVSGSLDGPLEEPQQWKMDGQVAIDNVAAGGFGFERVAAQARGSATSAHVAATLEDTFGPDVQVAGHVFPLDRRAEDLTLAVSRRGVGIDGRIGRLDLDEGRLEVRDLRVTGAGGSLQGSLRMHPDLLELNANGDELDLGKIARALGLGRAAMDGKLKFSADVTTSQELSRGRVAVAVGDATLGPVSGITASARADLNRDRFEGTASVIVAERGVFGIAWETTLEGPVLEPESWLGLLGRAEVYLGEVNLAGAQHLLGEQAPIERISGEAFGQVTLERSRADALPDVVAVVGTKQLRVERAPPKGEAPAAAALVIDDIDVQVGATIAGTSGDSRLTVRLVDPQGLFAVATATTQLDLERMVAEPQGVEAQLWSTPLSAVLTVPERPVQALPRQLRPTGLEGHVSGRLTLGGTLREPIVSTTLACRGLRSQQSRLALPVDLRLAAQYQQRTGAFGGRAELLQAGSRVALLRARGTAPWQQLSQPAPNELPRWEGEAELLLEGLPVAVVPALADNRIGGTLDGVVAIHQEAGLPQARASLTVHGASVERILLGDGSLGLQSNGKSFSARLSLAREGRSLTATGRGALLWVDGWPTLDESRPALVDLQTRRFDAVVLQPLLSGTFSRLSGEIDADLQAELAEQQDPDQATAKRWTGRFRGSARLRKGLVQLAGLGLTLRDVSLDAVASHREKISMIRITELKGKARSEKHNLRASGTLYLDGLRFSHGQADLHTVDEEVPLLVEGVTLATVSGRASAQLEREDERIMVRVQVPELQARLPRSSERQLIELGPNPGIEITQPLGEPEQERSGDALPWRIVFNLGEDVRIVRSDLYIPVTGQPVIALGDQTEVSGYIDLEAGGRLQALGKEFEVKSGRLRFDTGDNSDPHIDVTAAWQATGATVYVEIHGTLKRAELSFRSEPPRPEREVMALLLGASDEQGEPGEEGSQTGVALGAGSEAAAPILDRLLSNTPLAEVRFRATADAGKPSYTAAYRISDQVWLEGIYRPEGGLGQADSSEGSDLSGQGRQDAFAGAVDYRFSRNWSLRTEGGNASAGLDVLWQYRY